MRRVLRLARLSHHLRGGGCGHHSYGLRRAGTAAGGAGDGGGPAASSAASSADLEDEYGDMDDSGDTHVIPLVRLECGAELRDVRVRYNTFGSLNAARDNVLVVCHALTGNARLDTWWGAMLGPGKAFDTDKYLVYCANILGSCYGSTGPRDEDPATGLPYGASFPAVTVRDTVAAHAAALTAPAEQGGVGAASVACVIGGSFGGMQTLEWAAMFPHLVRAAMPIACGARHHAWQIAISECQRQAIRADPDWAATAGLPRPDGALALAPRGLAIARMIAMVSYRTHAAFENKFGRRRVPSAVAGGAEEEEEEEEEVEAFGRDAWQVRGYLEYQGEKFLSRFDAATYIGLTEQMDSHDLGKAREGGVAAVLAAMTLPTLVMTIESDVLYPPAEQEELAAGLPNARYVTIPSNNGHDGFLLEQHDVGAAITAFLDELDGGQRAR